MWDIYKSKIKIIIYWYITKRLNFIFRHNSTIVTVIKCTYNYLYLIKCFYLKIVKSLFWEYSLFTLYSNVTS